jgi:hypothetical protein
MLISLTFWKAGNTNDLAIEVSKASIKAVTRAVNGKLIGIDNRTLYTNKAYETLKNKLMIVLLFIANIGCGQNSSNISSNLKDFEGIWLFIPPDWSNDTSFCFRFY